MSTMQYPDCMVKVLVPGVNKASPMLGQLPVPLPKVELLVTVATGQKAFSPVAEYSIPYNYYIVVQLISHSHKDKTATYVQYLTSYSRILQL